MSGYEARDGAGAGAGVADSLGYAEWCAALRDGALLGLACSDCDRVYGTPVSVCDSCGSRDLETVQFPTTGDVYTETTVHVPPVAFDGPYQVGLVEIGEARVMGRLQGDVEIGDAVELIDVIDHDGDPAPVFAPDRER